MPFSSASKTCEFEYIAPRSIGWKHIKQFLHKPIFNESKISRLWYKINYFIETGTRFALLMAHPLCSTKCKRFQLPPNTAAHCTKYYRMNKVSVNLCRLVMWCVLYLQAIKHSYYYCTTNGFIGWKCEIESKGKRKHDFFTFWLIVLCTQNRFLCTLLMGLAPKSVPPSLVEYEQKANICFNPSADKIS